MTDIKRFDARMKDRNAVFKEIASVCSAKAGEPMAPHTSFRVGGPADIFAEPENTEQLSAVLAIVKREGIPFVTIGNGTNLLVRDEGYRGAVIKIAKGFSASSIKGLTVKAGAGMTLAALARRAAEASIGGFEELSGIPGTVGGAVRMNAGAYGVSVSDLLKSVTYLLDGQVITKDAAFAELSYRHSIFCEMKDAVILEAVFEGKEIRKKEDIIAACEGYNERRRSSQPLEYFSAGSTFKRPKEGYASKLIDECGLKGFKVGGAEVSEKHAGFVINKGEATAEDILAVMEKVRETVLEKKGILLEPEVVIL